MSLSSSLRAWVDKFIGWEMEEPKCKPVDTIADEDPIPSTSKTKDHTNKEKERSNTTKTSKEQKSKGQNSKQKSSSENRPYRKDSNVLRASVVATERDIIPPLPRMSIEEDTSEKLRKALQKLDQLSIEDFSDYKKNE